MATDSRQQGVALVEDTTARSDRQEAEHRIPVMSRLPNGNDYTSQWKRHRGPCALRSDVHEEASVKTGARRSRDFPDIHSASSATAERHEGVCGRSHSIPRRRDAPRRTSGCDLSPATDLDLDGLLPAGPVCAGPGSRWKPAKTYQSDYQFG
jgi:hypothetical protein